MGLFDWISELNEEKFSGSACICETHQPERFWLNADASWNMPCIVVALEVSQFPIARLKKWLKENIPENPKKVNNETTEIQCSNKDLAPKSILALVFLTGFVSFNLEMAWTRLFSLAFGASVYAFAIVLSGYLCGIALGSLFFSFIKKDVKSR